MRLLQGPPDIGAGGPTQFHGIVFSTDDPSKVLTLEKGRRPGQRMPPQAPIERWVRRKLAGPAQAAFAAFERLRRLATTKAGGANIARALSKRIPKSGQAFEAFLAGFVFIVRRAIGRNGFPGIFAFKASADIQREGRAAEVYRRWLSVEAQRGLSGFKPRAARAAIAETMAEAQSEIKRTIAEFEDPRGYRGRMDTGAFVNSIQASPPMDGPAPGESA